MDHGIAERVAMVTGGSKGIGLGATEALVGERVDVVICARHRDELESAAEKIRSQYPDGGAVHAVEADVADRRRLVSGTLARFDGLDILVNNAGTAGAIGDFHAIDLTPRVLPDLREQGWGRAGREHLVGERPAALPGHAPYNASKAALTDLGRALSKACGHEGILVNTVSPAFIRTPLVDEMMAEAAEEQGVGVEEVIDGFLENARPHIEMARMTEAAARCALREGVAPNRTVR